MSPTEIICLALAAMAAGLINAVAGGGTMITFPVLLLFGTAPVTANATSTVALVIGTAGSIFGFRGHMAVIKPWLSRFVPVSILGGWLGSLMLTRTSDEAFARLVPFLILFATVLFFAQGAFRRFSRREALGASARGRGVWVAVAFQFAVAIYGGYFGAAQGVLLMAVLGIVIPEDLQRLNALKNVLVATANTSAAVVFIVRGGIAWEAAGIIAVGSVIGGQLGARIGRRLPALVYRSVIVVIGLVAFVRLVAL